MKIVFIGRYGEGEILNGPERVARELYSELKGSDNEVDFIEFFFSDYIGSSFAKKIFGKQIINQKHIFRLGIFPIIFWLCCKRYDVIHVINHQRFILVIYFIKPFLKSKIVTTFHGLVREEVPKNNFLLKRYFLDLWVEKILVKKSNLLIFPSDLLLENFMNYYEFQKKRSQIIPNGVNEIFSNPDSTYPPIKNSIKIVFYDGFDKSINRGLSELIKLLGMTKCKIELFIIGERSELNFPKNIELKFTKLMSQQELKGFFRDKHFIIKSIVFDAFSIFVAECMLAGVIPIINEKTGIKSFIRHKVNGFIYASESPNELRELLNEIFDGRYNLNQISEKAKNINEQLSWKKISRKYLSTYESVL